MTPLDLAVELRRMTPEPVGQREGLAERRVVDVLVVLAVGHGGRA